MRNLSVSTVDAIKRPVLAIATEYPSDAFLPSHSHRRAQFLYGAKGVMEVVTEDGAWVVPPQRGVWIPPEKQHQVRMLGVSTSSLYIEPHVAPRKGQQCEVLSVSPLLRQLLLEAVEISPEYSLKGRDAKLMLLLLEELALADTMPLHVPFPKELELAKLCVAFMKKPDIHTSVATWAKFLNVSERTFSRRFRIETGVAFGQWRQRACVVTAMARLSTGEPITVVALDLGYDSPAAFSTMFRRMLGQSPSEFRAP